jgi:outer membrane immunogenic protein
MRIWMSGLFALALSGSGAAAADFGAAAPIDAAPAAFDWQGFYIGASAGYGWLEDVDRAPPPPFVAPLYDEGDDWIFGAHAGYLHQFGHFVAGFEAQAVKLDITYEGFDFITVDNSYMLKGRAGLAFDRLLLTGHVGAAYAETNIDLKDWGRVAGVGFDYAITDNLIAGVSYDHLWFEEFDGTMIDASLDLLQARLSFKF